MNHNSLDGLVAKEDSSQMPLEARGPGAVLEWSAALASVPIDGIVDAPVSCRDGSPRDEDFERHLG